jgi:hypothetical protein
MLFGFPSFTLPCLPFVLKSEFSQHVGLIQVCNMIPATAAVPVPLPPHLPGGCVPFVPCLTFPKLSVLSLYSPTQEDRSFFLLIIIPVYYQIMVLFSFDKRTKRVLPLIFTL